MAEQGAAKPGKTVHLVSLGCPKNRVDSEVMLGHLLGDGYRYTDEASQAELIVVNTCGFIEAAKEESVEAILDVARFKDEGALETLVVAGCLSQRYAPDLARDIPEVDHFVGTGNFEEIADVVAGRPTQTTGARGLAIVDPSTSAPRPTAVRKRGLTPFRHDTVHSEGRTFSIPDPDFTLTAASPRVASLPSYMRYLKVSEGCSNTCAFCIIPKLRGPQKSRRTDDIAQELADAARTGCKELNLIAQDLCAYGKDLTPQEGLAGLLTALDRAAAGVAAQTGEPVWIRCLYAYPRGMTTKVMAAMARAEHVVPYLDMPLQHISDRLLSAMRRGKGGDATRAIVERLRERVPGIAIRTTFITGLPGETDEDFEELCAFVRESRFESMGVFAYSREEDTPAAQMQGQVPEEVARERAEALMAMQRDIARAQQEALVGKEITVLVEGVSDETDLLLQGRHAQQAPEIDGVVYINDGQASPGDFVTVRIEQALEHDVVGGIVSGRA